MVHTVTVLCFWCKSWDIQHWENCHSNALRGIHRVAFQKIDCNTQLHHQMPANSYTLAFESKAIYFAALPPPKMWWQLTSESRMNRRILLSCFEGYVLKKNTQKLQRNPALVCFHLRNTVNTANKDFIQIKPRHWVCLSLNFIEPLNGYGEIHERLFICFVCFLNFIYLFF